MEGIKLYSTFHKPFCIPNADYVFPVQAGKKLALNKMDIRGDDTGDNISHLNPFFAELTVIYWVIKNEERNCNAWGLCHYRRYFMLQKNTLLIPKKSDYSLQQTQKKMDEMVTNILYQQIEKKLISNDAIVQLPKYIHKKKGEIKNLEQNYLNNHIMEHWQIMKEVLFEKYPEYKSSWKAFCLSTKMSFYNMMIAKWHIWDEYATWLFDILFEVDKRIKISEDIYQQRVLAFISERLLNLFLMHNKIKITYLPVAVFDK